ncbi:hypothetical protein [Actinosynnema pretiosum]|uniref:Uncharacterized protein n=1 Tax=Actinosynnema pretiosum TaxID=42197 RepID=A0A290Z8Q6_9PSEU|nr:hypothetical protein [Actinosynnema pretiosum]ATE55410.1 hypothetical protein CNX65_20740 [Actinosynnema pretiosum]
MADGDAAVLLGELDALRKRTRRDRRGHWLPLLAIGALTLGAIPFYRPAPDPCRVLVTALGVCDSGEVPSTTFTVPGLGRFDPLGAFTAGNIYDPVSPLALGAYWLLALLAGLLLTTWWYRRRAEVSGLETSTKAYARVTLAGLLVVLGMSLVRAVAAEPVSHLRLGAKAAVLESAVFLAVPVVLAVLSEREFGRTRGYRVALVAGFALTSVLGAAVVSKTGGLLLFAAGLLVLAWRERSAWCGAVALGYSWFTLLANGSWMGSVFWRLGWRPDPATGMEEVLFAAKDVLLPGATAIVGGLVALVLSRVRR